MAIYLREDCRPLRDALQLEMVVAQYCLRIRDVVTTAGVPAGDPVGAGVVDELEREGDPLSHAILRAVAHLGASETAKRGADAVSRLTARAVGVPQHFAETGKARAVGAWRAEAAGLDGEYALFADFEHTAGTRHAIALFIDARDGGVVKHLGLLSAMSELDPADPFHPNALDTMQISSAGALMREVLERSYGPVAAETDDHRVLIAAARGRSMALTSDARVPKGFH